VEVVMVDERLPPKWLAVVDLEHVVRFGWLERIVDRMSRQG
jgi:hypothetical protein